MTEVQSLWLDTMVMNQSSVEPILQTDAVEGGGHLNIKQKRVSGLSMDKKTKKSICVTELVLQNKLSSGICHLEQ